MGLDVEGDRTREKGKEGKRRGEKATRRAAAREQARRRSAAGLGSTYRNQKANQENASASADSGRGRGHSDNGLEDFPAGGNGVYGLGMQGSPLVGQERSIRPRTGIHTSEVKCIMLPPTIFI